MSVVGKHILSGRPVEMTRLPDNNLLFKVAPRPGDPFGIDGIAFEIDQLKLQGAFGTAGIVIRKEAILTHRDCGCLISGADGSILPCVCSPLIEHAFVTMLKGTERLPNERCLKCAAPRARHRDRRCELHNADPCNICHPKNKE